MKEKIVLVGGGGHCKVVIDAIVNRGRYDIEGITDAQLPPGSKVSGISVLGNDDVLFDLYKKGVRNAFICAGSIGNCNVRKTLYKKAKDIGFEMPVIVHPKAVVAHDVKIEEGTFVAASATVNPGTRIGKNVILNTSSSIDHDCEIGDFVHISPGVTLSGGVRIGEETHVGTGANIIQCVKIGKKCFVPAGSLVKVDQQSSSKLGMDENSETTE